MLTVLILAPFTVRAQAPAGPSISAPQIVTAATAEVELKPDRAILILSVESRGATAAVAGAETARKQRTVLDAVRSLGIAPDQMTTASIEIHPEIVYPGENKPLRVSGYVARNSVRVEVRSIDQTGAVIDAALANEATGISSLKFTSSKQDDARRQALELAVVKAKAEAEAMARAAGGSLGTLIELAAQSAFDRPIALEWNMMRAPAVQGPQPMPIAPGQITISATVNGRWAYMTGR